MSVLCGTIASMSSTTARTHPGARFVALGDSFSSGAGLATADDLGRAPTAFPELVARTLGTDADLQARTGAAITEVLAQLPALGPATEVVTLTVGGNDVGFADAMRSCALPSWLTDCGHWVTVGRQVLHGTLPGRLTELLHRIRSSAPEATVVLAAYPHLFNGTDCHPATFFAPDEMEVLNAATDDLDDTLLRCGQEAGVATVDPRPTFAGHAVCDTTPWIHGLTWPVSRSFHPTDAGNDELAVLVATRVRQLGHAPVPSERAGSWGPEQAGAASAAPAALAPTDSLQDVCRAVAAMHLDHPVNLARARAAGVDDRRVLALTRALQTPDPARQQEALADLEGLHRDHLAARGGCRVQPVRP